MKLRGNPTEIFKYTSHVYCGKYDIDDENKKIVEKLILYFTRNNDFNDENYNLDKGIMLIGNAGSGKTTLLEIFKILVSNTEMKFSQKRTNDFADMFAQNGVSILNDTIFADNLFFDDLGFEEKVNYFGNKRESMRDMIFKRYIKWESEHKTTHFTTMLSLDDIGVRYGMFERSRIEQMCNVFYLGESENSIDRRKYMNRKPICDLKKMPLFFISDEEIKRQKQRDEMNEVYKRLAKEGHEQQPLKPKGFGSRMKENIQAAYPNTFDSEKI